MIPGMKENRSIEVRSSSEEWERLFEWILSKSEPYKDKNINPWQRPELSKEEVEKRLSYASLSYGTMY